MSEQDKQIERAKTVKARHVKHLMSIPGVVGVGVGLRQRRGQFTNEVAIVVMVQNKAAPGKVPAKQMLPSELDGVPVDVQETGEIRAN